ncbi:PREDICTED: patatin-like phospholipase domain-containing protein 2 [Cyprinodon variegatus]|uniref:patatin-like phospholipase domain-containing protein 2 n=1 Tax=Cyprinodon variegatus TaxID=28743 RepID=UPI000742C974|nr:PREDICTED: patatin-like phospholipase domain-containing protein 2 [Cyprinodon variegatus]
MAVILALVSTWRAVRPYKEMPPHIITDPGSTSFSTVSPDSLFNQLCFSILNLAREARKHTLGVFHPTFRMLEMVRRSLLEMLPEDAHLRATGKLCVSLTRLADGGNVLVSKFDTREELIQVLICSCFFPVYCGFIPPSYHGVHYVDGALSNNMPMFEHRNTITMAPFSGESDICPREGTFNFFEASYSNVSIQVNTGNVYRVCTSFLPPSLETLAEICHNGYMDALGFLKERDLLSEKYSIVSVASWKDGTKPPCWEPGEEQAAGEERLRRKLQCDGRKPQIWLNHKVNNNLPSNIKKVLCEACRYNHHNGSQWTHSLTDFLPIRVICYTLTLLLLPIQLSLLLAKRLWDDLQTIYGNSISIRTDVEHWER